MSKTAVDSHIRSGNSLGFFLRRSHGYRIFGRRSRRRFSYSRSGRSYRLANRLFLLLTGNFCNCITERYNSLVFNTSFCSHFFFLKKLAHFLFIRSYHLLRKSRLAFFTGNFFQIRHFTAAAVFCNILRLYKAYAASGSFIIIGAVDIIIECRRNKCYIHNNLRCRAFSTVVSLRQRRADFTKPDPQCCHNFFKAVFGTRENQYNYIITYAAKKINTFLKISFENYTQFNFFGENNKLLLIFLSKTYYKLLKKL